MVVLAASLSSYSFVRSNDRQDNLPRTMVALIDKDKTIYKESTFAPWYQDKSIAALILSWLFCYMWLHFPFSFPSYIYLRLLYHYPGSFVYHPGGQ